MRVNSDYISDDKVGGQSILYTYDCTQCTSDIFRAICLALADILVNATFCLYPSTKKNIQPQTRITENRNADEINISTDNTKLQL